MKGFLVLLYIVASCLIYLYVPYLFWTWLLPVTFWQKVVMTIAVGMYEWVTMWIGFVFGIGVIAMIKD